MLRGPKVNLNTAASIGGLVLGNAIAETAFPAAAGGSIRGVLALPADQTFLSNTAAAAVAVPWAYVDGIPFLVKASCKVVSGGTGTFQFQAYWNSATATDLLTFTSDVVIATNIYTGPATPATAGAPCSFYLEAMCLWDSKSQQLCSAQGLGLANVKTTPIRVYGPWTINPLGPVATGLAASSGLQFFATALFGTTHPLNAATLVELAIERC